MVGVSSSGNLGWQVRTAPGHPCVRRGPRHWPDIRWAPGPCTARALAGPAAPEQSERAVPRRQSRGHPHHRRGAQVPFRACRSIPGRVRLGMLAASRVARRWDAKDSVSLAPPSRWRLRLAGASVSLAPPSRWRLRLAGASVSLAPPSRWRRPAPRRPASASLRRSRKRLLVLLDESTIYAINGSW
jgi:hypothetical protein